MTTIAVEEDRILRLLEVLFDPQPSPGRLAACNDYFAHDNVDLSVWRDDVRREISELFPVSLRFVEGQDEFRLALRDADAAVVESLEIRAPELDAARALAVVCKFGLITTNIDVASCEQRGITVRTVRRRTNVAVAEHTLALMLALAKKVTSLNRRVTIERIGAAGRPYRPYDKRYVGTNNYAREGAARNLADSVVGILGMGEIGREVAQRTRAFGATLIYHQRRRLPAAEEAQLAVEYRSLPGLFSEADFLTVHVPLTADTRGLVSEELLSRMRPDSFLINTSRAPIIEREALLGALNSGRLGGAAMDVQYEEPMRADDPLLACGSLVLTPHVAGGSRRNITGDIGEVVLGICESLPHKRQIMVT